MVNIVDRGQEFFYTPLQGVQKGDQAQGLENTSANGDVKNKDLGPKKCKT